MAKVSVAAFNKALKSAARFKTQTAKVRERVGTILQTSLDYGLSLGTGFGFGFWEGHSGERLEVFGMPGPALVAAALFVGSIYGIGGAENIARPIGMGAGTYWAGMEGFRLGTERRQEKAGIAPTGQSRALPGDSYVGAPEGFENFSFGMNAA